MQWLTKIIDELIANHPDGEIVVSSGVSPSGTYHLGTLREVLTAEVIAIELRRRGRTAKHLHIVDDLDVFRKVPANISEDWSQYLGLPLADVPAPGDAAGSYADFFLADLQAASKDMNLSMEIIRASERYRNGFFTTAIEKALGEIQTIRTVLEEVSGRKLDDQWSPIQIIEEGRVKNRQFVSIDTANKTVTYIDKDGHEATANYADGHVTMSWRVDWPARWWLLGVHAEPFGRDHATKGGSYDTGKRIVSEVFGREAPLPVPYNFINRVGDTKKMSKSAGNVITAKELLTILPTEIVWYFLLRSAPDKQLFFGEGETLLRLFDEFAELQAKPAKTPAEQHLLDLCLQGVDLPTVSNVPFSHLVASYQAALKDTEKTLHIISRTEHAEAVIQQADIIRRELVFIENWLNNWAPDELKFSLAETINADQFSDTEKHLFSAMAKSVATAPNDADGAYFHNSIYEQKDALGMQPKEMFAALYKLLIGQDSGPRAGWFLSILPRDWLLERLELKK